MLFEIILGVVVVLAIIVLFITIVNNKYLFAIIKIEEAENNIEVLLHKKYDLLERCCPIIIKELKLKDFLPEISEIKMDEISHFELSNALKNGYNNVLKTIDDNEKLLKSESLMTIMDDLEKNDIDLTAAEKFYNDNVTIFNKLIVSFPSRIIGFFKRYKKKDFYSNEKKEMFEILNDR